MRKDYLGAVAAGALTGVALPAFSIYVEQLYGIALFFGIPVAIGFVVSGVLRRFGARPLRDSMLCTFGAAFVASMGFLVMGREGLICVLMAVPIASPFLAIGALLGYFAFHRRRAPAASVVAMLVIVATMVHVEANVRREPRVEIVEDSVIIHATPAEVWSSVVALDAVPRPRNWMYRVGLACPQRTRIQSQRLYPTFYWSLFCEAGISQIHRTVLDHVRNMAEARSGTSVRI